MRSDQELFDTIIHHLRKQGQKSVSMDYAPGYTCRYRSPDGLKCSIGALISDANYKPEMEEKPLDALLHSNLLPIDLQAEFQMHADLLRQLQHIHDHTYVEKWEDGFFLLSKKFNLKYITP